MFELEQMLVSAEAEGQDAAEDDCVAVKRDPRHGARVALALSCA